MSDWASPPSAPIIEQIQWGRMEVSGIGQGKDFKLWPGGGRIWDWDETGTRHWPGIQPTDVEELVANGASAVILSQGMWRALHTQQATLNTLAARGVDYEVTETREAVERYNARAANREAVGGLFHTTC